MTTLTFGALAPSLRDQIPALYVLSHVICAHFQNDADAITRLLVRGLCTSREGQAMRRRLMFAIRKALA